MGFDPVLAERRFGYGLSPVVDPPQNVAQMLAVNDADQQRFPIDPFRSLQDAHVLRRRFQTYARQHPDSDAGKAALEKMRGIQRQVRAQRDTAFVNWQLRRITTKQAFHERLVAFWGDHFTAVGKFSVLRVAAPFYVEEAVRPHVMGRFADMLTACVTHPLMLHYLDQSTSVGPNSIIATRRNRPLGLNENLAREVLELHTLGVDGPYGQTDVRQLAELFTGLAVSRDYSLKFRKRMAEPGAETVLGKTYSDKANLALVREALQDLARHPATATHIARKLAVHFVSEAPPPGLVAQIAEVYAQSDGDLSTCYAVMLDHPLAWTPAPANMRPPDEFVSAALRALNVTPDALAALEPKHIGRIFYNPLKLMGQPWLAPPGPGGFAEEDAAWITPQGVSARLEWAMNAPGRLVEALPDPGDFANRVLGPDVPGAVSFAAKSAENRKVAVGLILAAPAFQRR